MRARAPARTCAYSRPSAVGALAVRIVPSSYDAGMRRHRRDGGAGPPQVDVRQDHGGGDAASLRRATIRGLAALRRLERTRKGSGIVSAAALASKRRGKGRRLCGMLNGRP